MSSSPRLGALALAAALAACGDYSNSEVEYLNALPTREDIHSNLPETPPSSGKVRLGLVPATPTLGMTSKLYDDTKNANAFFKSIAAFLTGFVVEVQRHPPTRKEEHRRVWGPFVLEEHPTHEVRVVIERNPAALERYQYSFNFRQVGQDDTAWVAFILGQTDTVQTTRSGAGFVHFENRALVDAGLNTDPGMAELDSIDVVFDTRGDPQTVDMLIQFGLSSLTYAHQEWRDGRGTMSFVVDDWSSGYQLEVDSRWTGSAGGRGDVIVRDMFWGEVGRGAQCWDGEFLLTYHQSTVEEPYLLGAETRCPSNLPPLPGP